jgi:hypothetical protein
LVKPERGQSGKGPKRAAICAQNLSRLDARYSYCTDNRMANRFE